MIEYTATDATLSSKISDYNTALEILDKHKGNLNKINIIIMEMETAYRKLLDIVKMYYKDISPADKQWYEQQGKGIFRKELNFLKGLVNNLQGQMRSMPKLTPILIARFARLKNTSEDSKLNTLLDEIPDYTPPTPPRSSSPVIDYDDAVIKTQPEDEKKCCPGFECNFL